MNSQNVIYIELDKTEQKAMDQAIELLNGLENIVRENSEFDYTRDIFHEARCKLIRIKKEKFLTDSGLYQVAKKEAETNPRTGDKEYVKGLAKRYHNYELAGAWTEEELTPMENIIKDFTKANTPDSPILYYIESLLDSCDVED